MFSDFERQNSSFLPKTAVFTNPADVTPYLCYSLQQIVYYIYFQFSKWLV
jgi:hypothetical protein